MIVPGAIAAMVVAKSRGLPSGEPLIVVITSPASIPALAAGCRLRGGRKSLRKEPPYPNCLQQVRSSAHFDTDPCAGRRILVDGQRPGLAMKARRYRRQYNCRGPMPALKRSLQIPLLARQSPSRTPQLGSRGAEKRSRRRRTERHLQPRLVHATRRSRAPGTAHSHDKRCHSRTGQVI
jgi:hypothetical protein